MTNEALWPMANTMLVFVYGSLLRGGQYHHLIRGAPCEGPARTAPLFTLVDLGPYPALVPGGCTAVHGELYKADDALLQRLDELEGHPDFYQRQIIPLDDGRTAQSYLLAQSRGEPIVSGDWRTHIAARRRCDPTSY